MNSFPKVQSETTREEFIYGITNRTKRSFFRKFQIFLIDKSRVPVKEKAYFFELLGTMIRAGIPLNRALKILVARTEHSRLQRIIATLSYELEHGYSLSQTLENFRMYFWKRSAA